MRTLRKRLYGPDPILKQLRKTIRTAVPKAKESISYHIPYYGYKGRVAYFAVYKNHCSFFWISSSDKKAFKKELTSHKVVGNTLRILPGEKVPVAVIRKLAKAHAKKNEARVK
ncbi:MAG TPA: DUF1801 domain-containing protein [Candidatus Paceibacterota bacterium]